MRTLTGALIFLGLVASGLAGASNHCAKFLARPVTEDELIIVARGYPRLAPALAEIHAHLDVQAARSARLDQARAQVADMTGNLRRVERWAHVLGFYPTRRLRALRSAERRLERRNETYTVGLAHGVSIGETFEAHMRAALVSYGMSRRDEFFQRLFNGARDQELFLQQAKAIDGALDEASTVLDEISLRLATGTEAGPDYERREMKAPASLAMISRHLNRILEFYYLMPPVVTESIMVHTALVNLDKSVDQWREILDDRDPRAIDLLRRRLQTLRATLPRMRVEMFDQVRELKMRANEVLSVLEDLVANER